MRSLRPRVQLAAAAAALLCAGSAMSHDTWLTPEADTARGERVLALSTGAQFPQRESALSMAQLAGQRCLASRVPYLPRMTVPYYLFVGRK